MKADETGPQRRREERTPFSCDVLWSYASNPPLPQYEGTLVDVSKMGVGMLTQMNVKAARTIRIYAKDLWQSPRYAIVMWCDKISPNSYRSGLLFTGDF